MPDYHPPAPPMRILPELGDHNRAFWAGGADGRLRIAECSRCSLQVSRPAPDCPDCGGPLDARPVSGRGTVFTYTVNRQPFTPSVPIPYVIAIVELDENPELRIAANIVDCEPDSVRVGMPVEVRFERQEIEHDVIYAPVFAPLLHAANAASPGGDRLGHDSHAGKGRDVDYSTYTP